jgi:hypothetical protein
MAIDERARHQLYLRLEDVLGREEATALMEHLPPVGWADVVTKHDLDLRLEALEHKLSATFREEFARQTRTMVLAYTGSMVSVVGLVFAARLV